MMSNNADVYTVHNLQEEYEDDKAELADRGDGKKVFIKGGEHILSLLHPARFGVQFAGEDNWVPVSNAEMDYYVLNASGFDAVMRAAGVFFTVKTDRFSAFFKKIVEGGLPSKMTPAGSTRDEGPDADRQVKEHIRAFVERGIASGDFDADEFVLTTEHIYLPDENCVVMEAVGALVDHLTIGGMDPDPTAPPQALVQFRALMGDFNTKDDREGAEFKKAIMKAVASTPSITSKDVDLTDVQAAKFVHNFRANLIPAELMWDARSDDAAAEWARRCLPASERFAPLFQMALNAGLYKPLVDVWVKGTSYDDIAALTLHLATQVGFTAAEYLTPIVARAVCDLAQKYTSKIATARAENSTSVASNSLRMTIMVRAHTTAAQADKAAAESDKDVMSGDMQAALDADPSYIDLQAKLKVAHTAHEQCELMLAHACPLGLMFLGGGKVGNQKCLKPCAAAKTTLVMAKVLSDLMASTPSIVMRDNVWGDTIAEDHALKFVQQATSDLWMLLKQTVGKAYGNHAIVKFAKDEKDEASFFFCVERRRLAEPYLFRMYEAIGYGSKAANGFQAWFRCIGRLAAAVLMLRELDEAKSDALRTKLAEAITQQFHEVKCRFATMRAEPPSEAKRGADWHDPAGAAAKKIAFIEKMLAKIDDEIELGELGSMGGKLTASMTGAKKTIDETGEVVKTKRQKREEQYVAEGRQEVVWGSALEYNQVLLSSDKCTLCFGSGASTFPTPPDVAANCVAAYSLSEKAETRNKWCPTPATCWARAGEKAHDRVSGFAGDDATKTDNSKAWELVADGATLLAGPKEVAQPKAAGAGNGAARAAAGGKGGRGGKGKGGKGGKGKGKGGRGGKGNGSGQGF